MRYVYTIGYSYKQYAYTWLIDMDVVFCRDLGKSYTTCVVLENINAVSDLLIF